MARHHVNIPRPLTAAVPTIEALVQSFLSGTGMTLGVYLTLVSHFTFETTLTMLKEYPHWDHVADVEQHHSYRYHVTPGVPVCTRVVIGDGVRVSHVIPSLERMVELRLGNHGQAHARLEREVTPAHVPETVLPEQVTLESRWGFTKAPWKFHVGCAWSGQSRSEAERAQAAGAKACTYTIGVSFHPNPEYLKMANHTPAYIATSLLMKVVDLVSAEMITVDMRAS
jgi:hypothetical protein